MLKFGQTIDLEKLERMGVNKNADELREKLQKEDNKRLAELHSVEGEINRLKEELTEITKENTSRMESLVSLTEQQQRLEDSLNHSQSTVTAEYSGPLKKDMIERQKLIELVRTQNGEIEALRREIDFLIRKPIRPPSMNRTMAPPVRKSVIGYSRPLLPQISELRPSRGDFFEEENMNEPNAQQEHFEDGSENVVPVSAEMTDVPQSSQSDAGGEVLESAES
ncbi:hypothetical protein BJ742DRAFT_32185 [Cladochytrium replicatum]|nr:hypothetical protein BJ742DRAFT_32185 [Cladochytrium replicatum]